MSYFTPDNLFDLKRYCREKFDKKREIGSRLFISCPFHNDKTPSMLVSDSHVYCFSCQVRMWADEFYQKMEGIDSRVSITVKKTPQRSVKMPVITDSYIEVINKTLISNRKALEYLNNRGISLNTIKQRKIGYAKPLIPRAKFPRFAFPTYDINHNLVNISYRVDPKYSHYKEGLESQKYVLLPGSSSSIYGIEYLDKYDSFIYTGGQIDCLTLFQMGIPALGALGEASFKEEWVGYFEDKTLYLLLDNDEAGIRATERIVRMMPDAIPISWPKGTEGMDVNSLVRDRRYGPRAIKEMIEGVGCSIRDIAKPKGV